MKFVVALAAVLLTGPGARAQKACFSVGSEHVRRIGGESFLELGPRRVVSFEFVRPLRAGHPTLVFLPGLFRGMEQRDAAVQSLAREGFGTLRTTTRDHWESLKGLTPAEARARRGEEDAGADGYARDVEGVLNELAVARPVTISLSYSAVVLARMSGRRIFVAPLVKAADSDPSSAAALRSWESLMALNPFFGPSAIRANRDSIYRQFWSAITGANLRADADAYGKGMDRELVIESAMRLSRSTEDFHLVEAMTRTDGPVDFVLGEFESRIMLRGQLEAALAAAKRAPVRVILIRGAEHNVPDAQPAAFHTAIRELAPAEGTDGLRLGVIDPRADAGLVRWLDEVETKRVLDEVLSFPDSTAAADLSGSLGP